MAGESNPFLRPWVLVCKTLCALVHPCRSAGCTASHQLHGLCTFSLQSSPDTVDLEPRQSHKWGSNFFQPVKLDSLHQTNKLCVCRNTMQKMLKLARKATLNRFLELKCLEMHLKEVDIMQKKNMKGVALQHQLLWVKFAQRTVDWGKKRKTSEKKNWAQYDEGRKEKAPGLKKRKKDERKQLCFNDGHDRDRDHVRHGRGCLQTAPLPWQRSLSDRPALSESALPALWCDSPSTHARALQGRWRR